MVNHKTTHHDKWKSIIAEQEASGLSQAAFCKQHDISVTKLGYYRSILKSKPKQAPASFHPIQIKEQNTPKDINLSLPNGFRLTFPQDIPAKQLKEWIKVLLSC